MNIDDWEYSQSREYARETLLFAWKRFEKKTDEIISLLNNPPLSNIALQGYQNTHVDILLITAKLNRVKSNLAIKITEISQLYFENDQSKNYTPDVPKDIKDNVGMGKTLGINWFQAFITKSGLPIRRLQDLKFLWNYFCSQNLWIRSAPSDPVFRTAKQSSPASLQMWFRANNLNLLSCFHEAILTINLMRNISQHWEDNFYSQDAFQKINKNLSDPLTDLQNTAINNFTLFISLANEVTGLLRSLEIFHESVQIVSKGGMTQSEKERKPYPITCSNCAQSDFVPFKPSRNSSVLCSTCFWSEEEQLLR